jgi:hypothetical protein
MGCDIHAYVESKRKDSKHWYGFGKRFNPGRHYGMFGRLAGVRCDGCLIEPKGIPSDLSWTADDDYWLRVNDDYAEDEGYTSQERALSYIKSGSKVKLNDDNTMDKVEHPDWHTPSWLTADELEKCLEVPAEWGDTEEYKAILAAMKSLELSGRDTRLVFWFDN